MSVSLEELQARIDNKGTKDRYTGVIDYHGVPIEPWNHPKSIARYILKVVSHTHSFGCQFIAPMGYGKSTAATIVSHFIHTEDPRYLVIWAEANDFRHLKRFLLSLPKEPMVIIFDDITSALKSMPEREVESNFEDLTKIRWIIDPARGEIPTILIVNYHYSKNLEKEFRAVLGMTIFLAFGAEEHTNIDTILPKRTIGRKTLEYYSSMSDKMFSQEEFKLMHSNGQVITYKTDKPCRAACAVMGKDSRIILLCDKDTCAKCAKTQFKKYADPATVVKVCTDAYLSYGKKALKFALFKRGFYEVFAPQFKACIEFVENKVFLQYDIRLDQLADELTKFDKIKKKSYRKRKKEELGLEELATTYETVILNEPKDMELKRIEVPEEVIKPTPELLAELEEDKDNEVMDF